MRQTTYIRILFPLLLSASGCRVINTFEPSVMPTPAATSYQAPQSTPTPMPTSMPTVYPEPIYTTQPTPSPSAAPTIMPEPSFSPPVSWPSASATLFPSCESTNSCQPQIPVTPIVQDSDGDGLSDSEEQSWGTSPWSQDSDGDRLTDFEEVRQIKGLNGANPLRKDIFVFVSYISEADGSSSRTQPDESIFSGIRDVFARDDIAFHYTLDSAIPYESEPDSTRFRELKIQRMGDRLETHHYAMYTTGQTGSSGTTAEGVGGQSFILRKLLMSGDRSSKEQHAFLHELGHTFGLMHGGNDGLECKPNYPSVMNYLYDVDDMRERARLEPSYSPDEAERLPALGFSSGTRPSLSETNGACGDQSPIITTLYDHNDAQFIKDHMLPFRNR